MIQRIQTLYLLISLVIVTLILFFPFFEFNAGEYIFNCFNITKISHNEIILIKNSYPLGILISIILLLHLIAIFTFKIRSLQMRITVLTIILLIGFYGLLAFYRFVMLDFEIISSETKYSFTLIIPIISTILVFLANRKIKKDDELVKSADRIR